MLKKKDMSLEKQEFENIVVYSNFKVKSAELTTVVTQKEVMTS